MCNLKLWELISDLNYQFPLGEIQCTCWPCCNDCGHSARGSGQCYRCIDKELAELVGQDLAAKIVGSYVVRQDALREAVRRLASAQG